MLNNDRDFKCPVTVGIEFITVNGTKTPDKEQICKTFASVASACDHPNLSSLSLCFIVDGTGYHAVLSGSEIANANPQDIKNRIHSYKNI